MRIGNGQKLLSSRSPAGARRGRLCVRWLRKLENSGYRANNRAGDIEHMTVAELPIQMDIRKIAAFCRERGIRKLSLFGSALHGDFDPRRSDVDVLIELEPGARPGLAYFGWADELSALIGHKVDLCSRLDAHIEDQVRSEALTVYEQT
jgi:predicted nucleotidyltransferase